MVSPAEQADALQGIALIETLAMTLTTSVFGAIFAYFSEVGRPFDVFFTNAVSFEFGFDMNEGDDLPSASPARRLWRSLLHSFYNSLDSRLDSIQQ